MHLPRSPAIAPALHVDRSGCSFGDELLHVSQHQRVERWLRNAAIPDRVTILMMIIHNAQRRDVAVRGDDRMTRIVTRDRSLNEQRREADKALEISAELCRIARDIPGTSDLHAWPRIAHRLVAEEENSAKPEPRVGLATTG